MNIKVLKDSSEIRDAASDLIVQEINLKLRQIEGGFAECLNEEIEKHDKRKHDNNTVSYHG